MNPLMYAAPPEKIMFHRRSLFALVATFALLAPAAYAQHFKKAPGQTFAIDLDTPGGDMSQWRHEDLNGVTALQASVRIGELRFDEHWLPVFTIWFDQVEGTTAVHRYGVQFLSRNRQSPLTVMVVEGDGFTKEKPIFTASESLDLYDPLNIQCSWENGNFTVWLGNKDKFVTKMEAHINRVMVTSSTGEITLDPLVLGNVEP